MTWIVHWKKYYSHHSFVGVSHILHTTIFRDNLGSNSYMSYTCTTALDVFMLLPRTVIPYLQFNTAREIKNACFRIMLYQNLHAYFSKKYKTTLLIRPTNNHQHCVLKIGLQIITLKRFLWVHSIKTSAFLNMVQ